MTDSRHAFKTVFHRNTHYIFVDLFLQNHLTHFYCFLAIFRHFQSAVFYYAQKTSQGVVWVTYVYLIEEKILFVFFEMLSSNAKRRKSVRHDFAIARCYYQAHNVKAAVTRKEKSIPEIIITARGNISYRNYQAGSSSDPIN